jgi:predicted transcriptional regulator
MDDDTPRGVDASSPPETEEEREARLAWEAKLAAETNGQRERRLVWEAEMIAEALEDVAAGRLIDSEDIDAWIESIGTHHELPPPEPRQR